jgi:hypothetical protein
MGVIDWRQRAPRASYRDRIAGFQERTTDFREQMAGFREHMAGFREHMAGFRDRVAGWRARNWRRAVLTWSVLCLICVAITAEPGTAFPLAQAHAVPVVGMIMKVAGGLTVAGVPALLIILP